MLTFKDIQDEVLLYWDAPGETGDFLTVVKNAINDAQAQRTDDQKWNFMLWEDTLTFSTASGTLGYVLHPLVNRLHRIYNTTTCTPLTEVPTREYYEEVPSKFDFHWVEPSPVLVQPSTTATVNIVSSSASDTEAAKAVTIRFLDGSDDIQEETLTPTGTTLVSTTASAKKILNVTKAGTWVGTMTLKDNATNTMLTLLTSEFGKQYPQIRLFKDPAATETIEYRFYRIPRILSLDNDIPDIPFPYSHILTWDTLMILVSYDEAKIPHLWTLKQNEWKTKMAIRYLEGDTPGARARQVRDVRRPVVRI